MRSKLINWLLILPAIVVAVVIALANRSFVTFSLDPLPFVVEVRLFIIILASLFLGVVIGALAMWFRDGRLRRRARAARQRSDLLQHELEQTRRHTALPGPAASRTG